MMSTHLHSPSEGAREASPGAGHQGCNCVLRLAPWRNNHQNERRRDERGNDREGPGMKSWMVLLTAVLATFVGASCDASPDVSDAAPSPVPTTKSSSPSPTPEPTRVVTEAVLALGHRGDIWVVTPDGKRQNITQSSQREGNPTISYDGERVVFERGPALVELNLNTGVERSFAKGAWPTFGPRGYLAWTTRDGDIVVGSSEVGEIASHPATKRGGAWVEHLAWDQNLELLFYEAVIGEGAVPYAMDVIRLNKWRCTSCPDGLDLASPKAIYPDNVRDRSEFLSTALGADATVVRVCCRAGEAGGWQEAEIGGIEYFDWGTRYHRLRELDDVQLDLSGAALLLRDAGRLSATVRDGHLSKWRHTNDTTWLLGDRTHLWLVSWHGRAVRLPFNATAGAAVSPKFSRSLFAKGH